VPYLRTADPANASAWLEPLTAGIAPGLTTGFFTSGGRGTALRFGIRYTASPISARDESFQPRLPGRVDFQGSSYTAPYEVAQGGPDSPTVGGFGRGSLLAPVGAYREALVAAGEDPERHTILLPPGLSLGSAHVPVVEAGIGLRGLGVQITGRFFPTVQLAPEVGRVRAFGGGVLVTLSRFLGVSFADIGLTAVTQKLDAGDYLDASGSAFGVLVSRSLPGLRAYTHGTITSADVDVRYTMDNPRELPALPPDGSTQAFRYRLDRQFRVGLGLEVSAPQVSLSAEYSPRSPGLFSLSLAVVGG
jgi:hypothetical protein